MCEHDECEHSLGPSSHCDECDRIKRAYILRQSMPRITLDAELCVCGNDHYPWPWYCRRQAGHVGPCALSRVIRTVRRRAGAPERKP